MKITWLGQGGFLFESNSCRICADPYFSDIVGELQGFRRLIAPPVKIEDLRPDILICTHNHLDHYDPPTVRKIMEIFPACILAGPSSVMEKAISDNISESRFRLLGNGYELDIGPFKLMPAPATHSDKSAIGVIISTDKMNIYLSGDTEYFPDLAENVRNLARGVIDISVICINGKLGNMNADEAMSVLKALEPGLAIPMHYGMFAENTVDPAAFLSKCSEAGIDSTALCPGKIFCRNYN